MDSTHMNNARLIWYPMQAVEQLTNCSFGTKTTRAYNWDYSNVNTSGMQDVVGRAWARHMQSVQAHHTTHNEQIMHGSRTG